MNDADFIRQALRLARRGYGATSPNPLVGAVLVQRGRVIGRGWHRRAGEPHAEIEALRDAWRKGDSPKGATLYITLEPCSTRGRTPPCTSAILAAGIRRVVIGSIDPNPKHRGRGIALLQRAGVTVVAPDPAERASGSSIEMAVECARLNETFNYWIVHRTPFVTVKAAMTLDGKIADAGGGSKWITGEKARAHAMTLRQGADAVLVGINTVLADDPSLTVRRLKSNFQSRASGTSSGNPQRPRRRIILDAQARTPLTAKVVSDSWARLTTIVVSRAAPKRRVAALAGRVSVWVAPAISGRINLRWVLKKLGCENVTSLLVEGGGEVNASFLLSGLAHRIAFFYAPKILCGRSVPKAVAGEGARRWSELLQLRELEWRRLGPDLYLTARVDEG